MTLYVGIVTHNSLIDLRRCFACLHAQTTSQFRIVAFDNASSDGSVAWLQEHEPDVQLVVNAKNIGYGRAHNAIIQAIGLQADDYYMALNPDAELAPNYIATLVETLQGSADIGWVTGKLLMKATATDGKASRQLYSAGHAMLRNGFAFNIGYGLPDDARFAHSREVFGAPGAAVIYKASLIASISDGEHFFDTSMFMYAEDTDVDWRARWQGWRCWYVAEAVAYHRGSQPSEILQIAVIANRYVGVCNSIQAAAASGMPDRPHHAIRIPSMVDLSEFNPTQRDQYRTQVRAQWGIAQTTPVIGWVGRLDRKKRVEDFIHAAAHVHREHAQAHFVVIGGADAFMPEYADELRHLAENLGLGKVLHFLGDRADVPRLLTGLDIFVWLSRGEGMPHVIAEAGAAALPVVATCDNGSAEQITDGETGLFVPPEAPEEVATAIMRLLDDGNLRCKMGQNLRAKVEREYSTAVLIPRWQTLFEELVFETAREHATVP